MTSSVRRSTLLGLVAGLMLPCLLASPPDLGAQETPLLGLDVSDSDGSPEVALGDIFERGGVRESLESGLPVRVALVIELWRDRFFDSQEGRDEWRATVLYDPLAGAYRIETLDTPLGRADSPSAALELLRDRVRIRLSPDESGTYYYLGRIEIETLSLSDLEELRRWLRGELAPAIDGDEDVEGALGRGIRRFFVRALGLPALRYQTRSEQFDWEGGS